MRLMPVVAFGGSSGIRGHAVRLLHQHGPWHLLSEGVFGYAGSAAHPARLSGFGSSFLRRSSLPLVVSARVLDVQLLG